MEPKFRTQQVFSDSYDTDIYGGMFYYNGGAAAVMREFDDEDYQWQYHSGNMSEAEYQKVVREYQEDYAAANARAMAKKAENQGGSFKKTYNAKNKQYLKEYDEKESEQIAADRQHRKDAMAKIKKDKARVEKGKATRAAKKSAAADDMTVRSELVEIGGGSKKKIRKTTTLTTAAKRKKNGKKGKAEYAHSAAYRENRPRRAMPSYNRHDPESIGRAGPGMVYSDDAWEQASTELKGAVRHARKKLKKMVKQQSGSRTTKRSGRGKAVNPNLEKSFRESYNSAKKLAAKEGFPYRVNTRNRVVKGGRLREEVIM